MELTENQEGRLYSLIRPVLKELNLELVEIVLKKENSQRILDVVIDKDDDINLDECAVASQKISIILDVEDLFPFEYFLEVGSPGIFRELKKEKDFHRYLNHRVKAIYKSSYKGKKQFVGVLRQHQDSNVTVEGKKQTLSIELENLKKIHLFPDL